MMKSRIRIIVVGLLMGAAEVVPGVSGGTIAFVSGIYERLIDAIRRLTPMRLLELRTLGIVGLWRKLEIDFLLMLFGAMLVSIFSLASSISYALENYPIVLWSFFFGLVLSSVWAIGRQLPLGVEAILGVGFGTALALIVTTMVPLEAEISPLMLFSGGCIAICAWILPGLSGSFILVVLGLYQTVIHAVKEFEFMILLYVGLGAGVGLICFSQVLGVLLHRYHTLTIAILTGFMLGSLAKIWPWKHTTSYQIKADGSQLPLVQEPVLPETYSYLTGQDSMLWLAVAAALIGIVLIVSMDRLALLASTDSDDSDVTSQVDDTADKDGR